MVHKRKTHELPFFEEHLELKKDFPKGEKQFQKYYYPLFP